MIRIIDKADCVGCYGCTQICPRFCIEMHADNQGFLYPKVDVSRCVECGMCERVCPVINQFSPRAPLFTYAAKNKVYRVLAKSSSGGVFRALADTVLQSGGRVYGARFDKNWDVIHAGIDSEEEIEALQTSKYLQSKIGNCYRSVRTDLQNNRIVLFTGTPCQIAGLKHFLRKDYGDKLILADTICHGVPSPEIWQRYLTEVLKDLNYSQSNVTRINFRDKRKGWQNYGLSIDFDDGKNFYCPMEKNLYMQGFLNDFYLRPSCFKCPAKTGKSESDITLGDFWGLQNVSPKLYDGKYYSLIITWTDRGRRILRQSNVDLGLVQFADALRGNPSIQHSATFSNKTPYFWNLYSQKGLEAIVLTLEKSRPNRIKLIAIKIIHSITKRLRK